MEIYEYTNVGSRECNQDYLIHKKISDNTAIFVLADGMGGYSHGEIAAKLVSDSIVEYIESNYLTEKPIPLIRQSIAYANNSLMLKRLAEGCKMGTVIALLFIINNEAYISWLGDSRVYAFRDNKLIYKTEDHSVVNDILKIKTLKIDADTLQKYSHIVTKSVMGDDNIGDIPISMFPISQGDVFVLCSDGFHKEADILTAVEYNDNKNIAMVSQTSSFSDNNSFITVKI